MLLLYNFSCGCMNDYGASVDIILREFTRDNVILVINKKSLIQVLNCQLTLNTPEYL